MASLWEKIKVYTKISIICIVALAVLIFIGSNSQPVDIRFLGWYISQPAWLLIVLAGLVGVVVFLIFSRTRSVLRDLRRVRDQKKGQDGNTQVADKTP